MPGLVIKDLPPGLHRKLKEQAARHHRSMTKEALAILERALDEEARPKEAPPPFKDRFPLTDEIVDHAKREGREAKSEAELIREAVQALVADQKRSRPRIPLGGFELGDPTIAERVDEALEGFGTE